MPSNQELLDAVVESWERQDLEAWLATCQPDAVLHTALLFPDFEPAYRGHDGLREFWRTLQEPWDTLRIRVVRMTELSDDEIVVEYHFVGEGGASGASTDLRLFNAVRLRDGLTSQLFARLTFEDAEAALRAG